MTPDELALTVATLQEDLGKAFESFERFGAKQRRESYILALVAFYHFLKQTRPTSDPVPGRFHELAAALLDLHYGVVHPILQHKVIKHRPGDPADVWGVRVQVVFALDCLLKSGMRPEEAGRLIQKEFPGLSRLLRRDQRSSVSSAVLNWRNSLSQGTVAHQIALRIFDDRIAATKKMGLAPEDYKPYALLTLGSAEKKGLVPCDKRGRRLKGLTHHLRFF